MKTEERIGKKYHQLLIVSISHSSKSKNRPYVNTICDCGKEKVIGLDNILRKAKPTKSCGCLGRINLKSFINTQPNYLAEFNRWVKQSTGPKRRDIETTLTLEDWIKLVSDCCYFCGQEPNQPMHNSYLFNKNGIDRLNSDIGYHLDNCVTACKQCNYAKQSVPAADFLAWIERVHNYQATPPQSAQDSATPQSTTASTPANETLLMAV